MYGVEEVHANDALGMRRGVGDLGDGERRGVRREQHLRPQSRAQPTEEVTLEFHALGDGFHHHLHALDGSLQIDGAGEPRDRARLVLLAHLPAGHALVEVPRDLRKAVGDRLLRDVEEAGLDAAHGEHLGDAVSHRAGAEDGSALDGCGEVLIRHGG